MLTLTLALELSLMFYQRFYFDYNNIVIIPQLLCIYRVACLLFGTRKLD